MNVLVTGVGAIIGYGIINSLRKVKNLNINILGMDIYSDAYGRFLCDKFFVAERADSLNYINFINNLIESEQIDLIIPGIEQDMYSLYEAQRLVKTKIVLNNDLLIKISKDKLATYDFFKGFPDIQLIPTLFQKEFNECVEMLGRPFLLKPRSSYASKGIRKISTQREFNFYNININDNIFQRIVGNDEEEYTVSIFGDGNGSFIDYIILKRKLAQTGATDKAEVVDDNQILEYVSKICYISKPKGPTNIQLRKENNSIYLLEINPRISSACSIRTNAGYNEPYLCLIYYLGLKIQYHPSPKKKIHAVRYISDYIYE